VGRECYRLAEHRVVRGRGELYAEDGWRNAARPIAIRAAAQVNKRRIGPRCRAAVTAGTVIGELHGMQSDRSRRISIEYAATAECCGTIAHDDDIRKRGG
jgi:hypothetical protein